MVIRTNLPSINAHRNLSNIGTKKATASRRLSSGFRINSAADDAAGLAVSEKMRAQIRGLDQSFRNAQDGISLIRTAEGGIATINDMIIRMRELVVKAANDTYIYSNREMIQWEIDQLIEEIDSLSNRVQFNTRTLLNGNFAKNSPIVLPTSQQLANEIAALASPSSAPAAITSISDTPPAPTVVIDSSNFAPNAVGTGWSVDSLGVLFIENSNHIIEINGTGLTGLERIIVAPDATANVILNNVWIDTSAGAAFDMRGSTVNLWLVNDNWIRTLNNNRAAIETTDGKLTINGTGRLSAFTSGNTGGFGAAIGGALNANCGEIIINGGIITAVSSGGGAAIGNGSGVGAGTGTSNGSAVGGSITINGGHIEAIAFGTTGSAGAGIGGGTFNSAEVIINGGTVSAQSERGAGIGFSYAAGNFMGAGGNITINGGTINAGSTWGAGIGGGQISGGGTIDMTGGIVRPYSVYGAAVGGGSGTPFGMGANFTISGGVLEIIHNEWWIGGGSATTNHGTTTYKNGNISFIGNTPTIRSGVFDEAGNPLSEYKITFDDIIWQPREAVSFLLYVSGEYRSFNVITDRNGEVFVWLREAPTDPPIITPPKETVPTFETQNEGLWIQTGANARQGLRLYIEATDALTLGLLDVAGNPVISVLHKSGYDISPLLQILDDALTHTNMVRATLGAVQNRLEFTSESLLVSSENLTEAESRIRNADMALEMMFLSGVKVLHQAAISMIAQANQTTNAVMQLLQDV